MTQRHTQGQVEYLAKRDGLPILSKFQVKRLIEKIRNGAPRESEAAFRKMMEHNTFLVWKSAARYYRNRQNNNLTLEDLFQEGNMGLMKAIEKFDPSTGNAFSTYAVWWINQKITRVYDDSDLTIRLPVHMREAMRRYYRIKKEMMDASEDGSVEPTLDQAWDELLRRHPKTTLELKGVLKRGQALQPASLDAQTAATIQDGGHSTLGDFVADEKLADEVTMENLPYGQEDLDKVLRLLPTRQERFVRLKFGLLYSGDTPRTLDEVGYLEGLTRERVRQVILDATLAMRREFSRRGYIIEGGLARYTQRADRTVEKAGDSPRAVDWRVLHDRRRERGIGRYELARAAGVADKDIGRIENGSYIPSYEALGRIAAVLGEKTDDLIPEADVVSEAKPVEVAS